MTKNRTTTHRGKSGYAKHNEHTFMKGRNISRWCVFKGMAFEDAELKFYEENYSDALEEQNAKYLAKRQYGRVKDMKQFYEASRYKPTEEIVQYGFMGGDVPDKETYRKMVSAYASKKMKWAKEHGDHLHMLNYANHFDEGTPHTHIREIWDYTDENGTKRINQEEAMRLSGLELPDPSKPVGRYNNRGMTYTKMCREMWQDICEEYGFAVERVPLSEKREHETVSEYHSRKDRELKLREASIRDREQAADQRENALASRELALDDLQEKLQEENAKELERFKRGLNERYERERDKLQEEYEKALTEDKRAYEEAINRYNNFVSKNSAKISEQQKAKKEKWEASDPVKSIKRKTPIDRNVPFPDMVDVPYTSEASDGYTPAD